MENHASGPNKMITAESKKMHFKKFTKPLRQTVLQWFEEDHVKAFYYGDGLQNTLRNIDLYCKGIKDNGRYTFDHWIAFYDSKPFGFLMTSPIIGPHNPNDDYNKWYIKGKKTFTLDLLIGDKSHLGKGLAHLMIQKFIPDESPHADYFIIDPESTNTRAIHVYEKARFNKVGEFCPDFNPKLHIMMRIGVNELKKLLKDEAK